MEGVTWEALPQRKRKVRSNDSGGNEVVVASSAAASQSEVSSGSGAALSIQRHREIAENIRARSILQRANATLESLDGCPGEFYECQSYRSVYCAGLRLATYILTFVSKFAWQISTIQLISSYIVGEKLSLMHSCTWHLACSII